MSFSDLVKLKLKELEEPRFDASLSGAHVYDASLSAPGFNLFDGKLMNQKGELVKSWNFRYLSTILSDGRYLAQEHYESKRWGLFTWDDKPIWINEEPIHHDICLTPHNTILTFTKEMHRYKGRDVDFCVVVEFDMQGKELSRFSTWDHLKELQKFHQPLELDTPKLFFLPETAKRKKPSPWGGQYDYYRLNAIQILPDTSLGLKDSRFRAGHWLISFRHGSMMFILDQDSKAIVWKCIDGDVADRLEGQHGAHMLANGNILIFDNGRYRGWSRVIEIDPRDNRIVWQFRQEGFYTLSQGYAQRLINGNTLITESERGRVFEVTPQGKTVWEYYHPDPQNEFNSQHPESYGRRQWIYRMLRYDQKFIEAFL
ncbi:MAG: hypothetical protein HQL15_09285 [Candidatus Omnitrophica bacterium]|nr:hypothetical protein [Candidatus Omnitrophota bacterium]